MAKYSWLVLGAVFVLLCVVTAAWVSIDRRPPEWDHANHLERAVECYRILSEPGHDGLREILDVSSFYPPIVPCAAGLLYFAFPIVPLTAQALMLGFLALGIAATFALGRHLFDPATGLLAAFFFGTAPFVIFSLTNFQLDLPLASMVVAALYALVRSEGFSRPGWCVTLGVMLGLGMVTKPPFAAYVLPAFCWTTWQVLRSADRRRRLGWLAVALVLGVAIALPWYGPRILGLPMQAANRSFKNAAAEGQAAYLSPESLLFYPRTLPSQLGVLASLLFLVGAWAVRRHRESRVFLWLSGVVPFMMFSMIQNRNFRYTLPILPAAALLAAVGARAFPPAWRRVGLWVCVVVGLVQVSMSSFAVPIPPSVPGLSLPLAIYQPPSRADWAHEAIIADLVRASAGRPATVAVVPNYNFFSVSNFRYDAARLGLPLRMTRAWSGPPLGVDFIILKTGSQGPSWTSQKLEKLSGALAGGDPYLAALYPVIGEYPLPDGSRGILRARRIQPLTGTSAPRLAQGLESAPAKLLADNIAGAVGLGIRIGYKPDSLLRGEAERVEIFADSALVGEMARRDRAPLRVRNIRIDIEGLLFDPRRFVETGELQLLGVKEISIGRATITEQDLRELLQGQPAGQGVMIALKDGFAETSVQRGALRVSARVRFVASPGDRPVSLEVEDVRIGPVAVPDVLANWVVRHFDPTLALRRLPMPVTVGPIRIRPGRIEVGGEGPQGGRG
jgi:DUF2993 family protein/dolichyl-phosphate-mannose-protein mannosyltransferase